MPLDICCWGVGSGSKGSYNYNPPHIQFEICEDGRTDEVYYRKAFDLAVKYCAYLCRKFGLTEQQIVSHKEAHALGYGCNHGDPEHWMKNFGENMNDFRSQVANLLDNQPEEKPSTATRVVGVGDLVSIAGNAIYYSGRAVPEWVKRQHWYVSDISSGDRAVINENEKRTNAIHSPISTKYLTVVHPKTVPIPDTFTAYRVKVIADCLNIRKSAGTNTEIVGCITDHGVYTIVKEELGLGASLWGKLKSGVGWISLDYVKKL